MNCAFFRNVTQRFDSFSYSNMYRLKVNVPFHNTSKCKSEQNFAKLDLIGLGIYFV